MLEKGYCMSDNRPYIPFFIANSILNLIDKQYGGNSKYT